MNSPLKPEEYTLSASEPISPLKEKTRKRSLQSIKKETKGNTLPVDLSKLTDKANARELPNLSTVTEKLIRGGQPTESGLAILKESGIHTIINLREEDSSIKQERELSQKLDLNYVSIPIRPFETPNNASLEKFLTLSTQKENLPCFVHCLHGMDRTGLMIGLYRLKVSDWSYEKAVKEMLSHGFHKEFKNLSEPLNQYARALGKLG